MKRLSSRMRFVLAIPFGVVLAMTPLSAVDPSGMMFYGGDLKEPVFIRTGFSNPTGFLWSPTRGGANYETMSGGTIPPNLEGRRYINMAIFWGPVPDPKQLKPEDAAQQGRIYLPTGSTPAVVVVTVPFMAGEHKEPVPTSLKGFIAGWALTPVEMAAAQRLGVPIF